MIQEIVQRHATSRPMRKEAEYLTALMELSKNKRVALDIGANVGNVSALFAEVFGEVYAFEPLPKTFQKYRQNIIFENILLSDSHKTVRFVVESVLSTIKNPGPNDKFVTMETYPLDFFVIQDVDIIKLDVENHELEVLKGAKNTIDRCTPIIGIEAHPPYLAAILRYMRETHDYRTVLSFDHENYILMKGLHPKTNNV